MNRAARKFAIGLLVVTSSCTYDLTEVRLDARDAGILVHVETTADRDISLHILVDPGVTERGTARTLVHESVLVDGMAYPPTAVEEGRRRYEIPVPVSATSISIVLPSISGVAAAPALSVTPLRLATADTLIPGAAGVLEIPVLVTKEDEASTLGAWNASLFATGTNGPLFTIMGQHPIPSVLRIPTIHLPPEVQSGYVDVHAMSFLSFAPDAAFQVGVQKVMRASAPFRISN